MATIEGIDISGLHGPKRGSYPAHFFRDEVSWSPSRSRFAIAYTICEVSMSNDVGCIAWGAQESGKSKIIQNPSGLLVCCWGYPFARWITETRFIVRIQLRDISRLLVPVLVIDTDGQFAVVPRTNVADSFLDVSIPLDLTFHDYSERKLNEEIRK